MPHSARWNSTEVKSNEARSSNGLKSSLRVRATLVPLRVSFLPAVSFSLSFSLPRSIPLSPFLETLLYPSTRGSHHVTNEFALERALRIGHGELRTEIPSYGVTDRE